MIVVIVVADVGVLVLTAAFLLDRFWPWGWNGRRRSIRLKAGRRDWE